jgi:hypothetical protein
LTKRYVDFVWDLGYQHAFQALKASLVDAHVLTQPDFKRPFCLDVDWSPKGVGAILSQKEGKFEKVVAYANKNWTEAQRKFHPMEGECYALIWGIMHFRQYLHMNHFILRTSHKPLEWLTIVSNPHGRKGKWIDMLQDFSFKIVHQPRLRHTNVDVLSRNPIGPATNDDDFNEEIQDIEIDTHEEAREILTIRTNKKTKWFGFRRKDKELLQHHECCFGINHWHYARSHQLYMVDVVLEEDQPKELIPHEEKNAKGVEILQDNDVRLELKRRKPHYYDKQQQLELVLAAQELFEASEHDLISTYSDNEDKCWTNMRNNDIWKDVTCMNLLQEGTIPNSVDPEECKRTRKRILNYR